MCMSMPESEWSLCFDQGSCVLTCVYMFMHGVHGCVHGCLCVSHVGKSMHLTLSTFVCACKSFS